MFSFGKLPYPGLSNADVVDKVLHGYRMESPFNCPSDIYEIMTRCWDAKPENRPTFGELLTTFKDILTKFRPQQQSTPTIVLEENDAHRSVYNSL
jgi:hypothetical protein